MTTVEQGWLIRTLWRVHAQSYVFPFVSVLNNAVYAILKGMVNRQDTRKPTLAESESELKAPSGYKMWLAVWIKQMDPGTGRTVVVWVVLDSVHRDYYNMIVLSNKYFVIETLPDITKTQICGSDPDKVMRDIFPYG